MNVAKVLQTLPQKLQTHLQWRAVHELNRKRIDVLARAVEQNAPASEGQPVILFNASTRIEDLSLNAAYQLLTGWALQLQGTPVVHFTCRRGMSRCVLGTDRDHPHNPPPCADCVDTTAMLSVHSDEHPFEYMEDAELAAALKDAGLDELMHWVWHEVPLGELALPATRWVLRRHHLVDDETTCFLFREYLLSCWNIARRFTALMDEVNPRAVVVFNGQFYPEATVRWLAKQRGLPVFSHEVALRPFTAFFTPGEATAYPIDIPTNFQLNSEQDQLLDEYLEDRFKGNFSMAGIRFWPEMRKLSPQFLEKTSQFKQIVPVFTNVIFDTSQGHANVLFEHMFAWLDEVLALARNHPETLFVIRAHPDENRPGKESRESVADWIAQSGADRFPNVQFVSSDEFISSYELIQCSKFVMVYNSTIGLEASLLGAAVLCGGRARFTQLTSVYFPASREEFDRLAEELLSAQQVSAPPEHRQNARRFLYYQLFRSSLPFDAFLENEGLRRGYVKLKPFDWRDLLPSHSPTMKTILDGILRHGNFLLEE